MRTFKVTFTKFPGTTDAATLKKISDAVNFSNIPGASRSKSTKLNPWTLSINETGNNTTVWRPFNRWMWAHHDEMGEAKIEFFEKKKVVETITLSGVRLIDVSDMGLWPNGNQTEFSVELEPSTLAWS